MVNPDRSGSLLRFDVEWRARMCGYMPGLHLGMAHLGTMAPGEGVKLRPPHGWAMDGPPGHLGV